ncbi:flagella biosynthesis regulatory protein FliT [Salmonella enterica]
MTISSPALNDWHALHALSITMLNLARSGQWDELIEKEVSYLQLVDSISHNPITMYPPTQVEAARLLLEKVLENESLLKDLLAERMSELRLLINQTTNQHSLTTTYGKLSGNILFPKNQTDPQL